MDKLEGQTCPMCMKKTLTLLEEDIEIPFFGKVFVFGMECSNCEYGQSDVEIADQQEPCKYTLEITSEEDMKIRVVKSGSATIKIPHITTITPGPVSEGYVSNVEGIFERVKAIIEQARDTEEDKDAQKKAKNLLKKIQKIMWGQEKSKLIIEDPTGNSAIVSDKAKKEKYKGK